MSPTKIRNRLWGWAPLLLLGVAVVALMGRAVYRNHLRNSLFDAIDRKDVAAVRAALDRGANPNAVQTSEKSWANSLTALLQAVMQEDVEIAAALLEKGADPNKEGNENIPLIVAVGKKNVLLVRLLLNHGADPNRGPRYGEPITHARDDEVYRLLREHGARVTFLQAIEHGDVDAMRELLAGGADPNRGVPGELTVPLAMAARREQPEIIRLLIRHGAGIDRRYSGWTPLGFAVANHSSAAVRTLLEAGADPNALQDGESPLAVARRRRSEQSARYWDENRRQWTRTADQQKRRMDEIIRLLEAKGAREVRRPPFL